MLQNMKYIAWVAGVVGLLGAGCATSNMGTAAKSSAGSTAKAAASAPTTETAERTRRVDPGERYRRVMERASRRGIRVIWVNPPKEVAASSVSPPHPDNR